MNGGQNPKVGALWVLGSLVSGGGSEVVWFCAQSDRDPWGWSIGNVITLRRRMTDLA